MISRVIAGVAFLIVALPSVMMAQKKPKYKLVWADEFNKNGSPDTANWSYEKGFVRNLEDQWYQPENAFCENGLLVIEARREARKNPMYEAGSTDWRTKRDSIHYSSSCIITRHKKEWQYGRFEMRARIDISAGLWPAWWTLGISKQWPANGEIDIMEYYRDQLLANFVVQAKEGKHEWHTEIKKVSEIGGKEWASKFHIWRMDWTKDFAALYVDDMLLNKISVDSLVNKDGSNFYPFRQPHYMLLDLAIGGANGGDPSNTVFPRRFEVDYVRVYQEK